MIECKKGMAVFDVKNAPVILSAPEAKRLYAGSRTELVLLTLLPGETLPAHRNPRKVLFFVLEGEGQLHLGEVELLLRAGQGIAVEKDHTRSWVNGGMDACKILVIKEMD